MTDEQLEVFIRESWKIEGYELDAIELSYLNELHSAFLSMGVPTCMALAARANLFTDYRGILRNRLGLDIWVRDHTPPDGGPEIPNLLDQLLERIIEGELMPYEAHVAFEDLHPFMDGNGRVGRLLWAWHMEYTQIDPHWADRGFLHTFYYQSLGAKR